MNIKYKSVEEPLRKIGRWTFISTWSVELIPYPLWDIVRNNVKNPVQRAFGEITWFPLRITIKTLIIFSIREG